MQVLLHRPGVRYTSAVLYLHNTAANALRAPRVATDHTDSVNAHLPGRLPQPDATLLCVPGPSWCQAGWCSQGSPPHSDTTTPDYKKHPLIRKHSLIRKYPLIPVHDRPENRAGDWYCQKKSS